MRRLRSGSGWRRGAIWALCALLLAVVAGCVPAAVQGGQQPRDTPGQTTARNEASQPEPVATAVPQAEQRLAPARLLIPKLKLDAPILALGPDASGAMQAPRIGGPANPIWSEVYWWDVGALPGQVGNAVIAGHVNRPDASPSTFTHLNDLVPGDHIEIMTANGTTLTFAVTTKDTPLVYVHGGNDPTVERIFGPSLTPNLNLLTCWGEWDGNEFDRRLVVYSTLIGASPFPHNTGTAGVG